MLFMTDVDYWAELPEKCKTSKRDRFNYIMAQIKGETTATETTPEETTDDGEH